MCEIEDLTLYAETETYYKNLLENSDFSEIQMRNENDNYYQYNIDIINRLKHENNDVNKSSIEGYQLIADSIKDNELLIRWFRSVKHP